MQLKLYREKWAAVWSERGATKRHSFRTADREQAEREFEDWKHKRAAAALPQGRVTVGDILKGYFEDRPAVIYRGRLVDWWNAKYPEHVTQESVALYVAARSKMRPSTIRSEVAILVSAINWARKKKWTTAEPEIELPPASAPRQTWITRDEADKLIEASRSIHMQLFTMIAVYTGARAGAILDLTWDRVTERFIDFTVPDKHTGRKKRANAPMSEELWPALVEARKIAQTPYVIEYGGAKVGSVKKAFQRQAVRAGLGKIGPHTIRHSVATWLAMNGTSMQEIADLLGNSVRMVEKVYAKFAPGYLAKAVASLSRGQVVQLNRSLEHLPMIEAKTEKKDAEKRNKIKARRAGT